MSLLLETAPRPAANFPWAPHLRQAFAQLLGVAPADGFFHVPRRWRIQAARCSMSNSKSEARNVTVKKWKKDRCPSSPQL